MPPTRPARSNKTTGKRCNKLHTARPAPSPQGARSGRRTKYALARAAARLTYAELRKNGFGNDTVARADAGELPKHRSTRIAYLALIGLPEDA